MRARTAAAKAAARFGVDYPEGYRGADVEPGICGALRAHGTTGGGRRRVRTARSGRFVSEGPARNGANWFAYADDNPVCCRDRTGRETEASVAVGMDGSMIIDGVGLDLEQTKIWCDLSESGRFAKVLVEYVRGGGQLNVFGLKNALQSWAMGNNIQVIQILARGLTVDGDARMRVMDTMVSNGIGLSPADNGMTQLFWILSI